jgi:2-polyprenyl-6-methoxyphenol hydroxylase-like FAD-dependent oxidoreductase
MGMPQDLHVAIVGAGLGGLCLAQGLRRVGVGVTVFERDASPESRGQGYRIRIDADGQDALRQTLPTELNVLFRQTCAAAVTTGRFLDTDLHEIAGRPVETWRPSTTSENDDAAQADRTANRQTLRQILMSGIEPHLRFGKALQSIEQAAQGVGCRFGDGSTARADLLVAADGASSTIRRALLPGSEPHDTGDVNIYGKTIMTPEHAAAVGSVVTDGISVVFDETFVVVIDAIRFRAPLPRLAARFAPHCSLTPVDDYLYWSFFGARSSLGLPAGRPPDVHGHVMALTSRWHPDLRALFRLADPDVLAMRPVLRAPPLTIDHHGPIAFLGDAIHAMSPAGGLGANTALRDAARLTEHIAAVAAGHATLPEALAAYHDDMTKRADRAVTLSDEGSRRLTNGSLLGRPPASEHG